MNRLNEIAKLITKGEIRGFEKGKLEAKKEILELINKTKLPEDKDYRYSNKYIDNWIDELKQQLQKEIGGMKNERE